jgi:hypothetical protein
MMRTALAATLFVLMAVPSAFAQPSNPARRATTREQLRALLLREGPTTAVNIAFQPSANNEWNFFGYLKGLKNVDQLEVVFSITPDGTIGLRVYPQYKGGYINVERAKDPVALMRQVLYFSDRNFLFWGADKDGDLFCGYTITVESGFPYESTLTVLRSIKNTDGFVGQLRPAIDGTRGVN